MPSFIDGLFYRCVFTIALQNILIIVSFVEADAQRLFPEFVYAHDDNLTAVQHLRLKCHLQSFPNIDQMDKHGCLEGAEANSPDRLSQRQRHRLELASVAAILFQYHHHMSPRHQRFLVSDLTVVPLPVLEATVKAAFSNVQIIFNF